MNSIFRHENENIIITFDFSNVLYFIYDKRIEETTVYFYENEQHVKFHIGDSDYMNMITKWKNYKQELANQPQQHIFL